MNVATQTTKLKNLPITAMLLDEQSLSNIVEDHELSAILEKYATLSDLNSRGYVTWSDLTSYDPDSSELDPHFFNWLTNISAAIEKIRNFEPSECVNRSELTAYLTSESDPVLRTISSNFQQTSSMSAYATSAWVTNNFVKVSDTGKFARIDEGWINNIKSTNNFDGKEVQFELSARANGPQIKLNADKSVHMQVDGEAFIFPLKSPAHGPSIEVGDNTYEKSYRDSNNVLRTANIIATRAWAASKFASADQTFKDKLTEMFNQCGMTKYIAEEDITLEQVIKFIKLLCAEYGPTSLT